jgi:hypothetical protein
VKQIRKRLTYANVMSSIAVFLILGGATAFAAGLAKNSVGTKQLKKEAVNAAKLKTGAVSGAKIATGAVDGSKVLDGSLTGSDIKLSTLGTVPSATKATTATAADTAKTAETAKSATTATTATTAVQLSKITVVKVDFTVASGAGSNTTETATCPAGTQAIAGGARNDAVSNNGAIITSRPVSGFSGAPETGEGFDGWRASITNTAAGALSSSVWAICAG